MKKFASVFILAAAFAAVLYSCRKDESDDSSFPGNTGGAQVSARITGMVLDESNDPVPGVSITAYGLSTTSDQNGIFLLEGNVNKTRCVMQFTKAGYLSRLHAIIPQPSTVNYVRIVMAAEPVPQYIASSAGGTVSLGAGGSVQFQANSFVIDGSTTPYNGTVSISARHLSPGSPNFGFMIPGGDLAGKNSAGEEVSLYSFGMTGVTMTGSGGEPLQLASGSTATITFPIASGQLGIAPLSIPLWYFDETDALWKEEGTATKVGNNYVGTVAHFSIWNCDYPGPRATVNGYVVDCEGIPMANVWVTINGGVTVATDGTGYYTTWVPSGWALTFQVLPQGAIVAPSQLENVAPLTTGQVFTVPDLVVPCGSYIVGGFTDCNNQPIGGAILVDYNNVIINFHYYSNGAFRLMVPASSSVTITVGTQSGYYSQVVGTPAAGDSIDLGTIAVCDDINSSFSFIIDGGGYDNVTVNMLDFTVHQASYYSAYDHTYCNVNGFSNLGNTFGSINFEGNQPVNLDLSLAVDSSFNLFLDNQQYFPAQGGSNHFYLNVTQYGGVGDSIKGTFNGKLVTWNDTTGVIISDGYFAIPRIQ